jgi:hypothetical protein
MLIEDLVEALNNKEKIVMPTNSIAWAQRVIMILKDKVKRPLKILEISSDTVRGNGNNEELKGKNWKNYDLVVYTGKITVGVSVDDEFDKIFCIFTQGSNVAQECAQMTYRARNIKSKIVNIWCAGNIKSVLASLYPGKYSELQNLLKDQKRYTQYPNYEALVEDVTKSLKGDEKILIPTNSLIETRKVIKCAKKKMGEKIRVLELEDKSKKLDNDVWSKYDMIIYTGNITMEKCVEDKINKIVCIFTVWNTSTQSCTQMAQNVVIGKCNTINVWCLNNKYETKDETHTLEIQELQRLLEEKYKEVASKENTSRFIYTNGSYEFLEDIYTLIWKHNELESRKSCQNLLKEIIHIIKRYVKSKNNIVFLEERKTNLNLNEVKEELRDKRNKAIAETKPIDRETYNKFCEGGDGISLEQECQMEKYKLADFYKVDQKEIDFDFVDKWKPRMFGLRNFCLAFLSSNDEIVKIDDNRLKDRYNDSLIHLIFDEDVKKLLLSSLDHFGFQMKKFPHFQFHSAVSGVDLESLNKILPQFVTKSRLKVNTKLKCSELNLCLRKIFGLVGIPFLNAKAPKSMQGVASFLIEINLMEMLKVFDKLKVKFKENTQASAQISQWANLIQKERILSQRSENPPPKNTSEKRREIRALNQQQIKESKDRESDELEEEEDLDDWNVDPREDPIETEENEDAFARLLESEIWKIPQEVRDSLSAVKTTQSITTTPPNLMNDVIVQEKFEDGKKRSIDSISQTQDIEHSIVLNPLNQTSNANAIPTPKKVRFDDSSIIEVPPPSDDE